MCLEDSPASPLKSGQPVALLDYASGLIENDGRDPLAEDGIVSLLMVPLWRTGRLNGLIGVGMRRECRFSDGDVQILTRLAHQVVASIENARLYQQVHNVAILEERDRLAREMHDNLAQTLGYLKFKAAIVEETLTRGDIALVRQGLAEMKQVADAGYIDVREAIFNLRVTMSGVQFLPTLREYLAEYRAHYGLAVQLHLEDESLVNFPVDMGVQVMRVIQEALANARRHGEARTVTVRADRQGAFTRISVEDDGHGFDVAAALSGREGHYGLQVMRERAESFGGKFEVQSQPGRGTRVSVWVPSAPER
jgi:two-component system nitrate/nitrite sensor histidine kinase NarX